MQLTIGHVTTQIHHNSMQTKLKQKIWNHSDFQLTHD